MHNWQVSVRAESVNNLRKVVNPYLHSMQRNYWEKIAPSYDEEIFDVLQNDKRRFIISAIRKLASPSKIVLDAGCAIGKWLPVLSPLFKEVIAADISAKNLAIAKKSYPDYANIIYLRNDMSATKASLATYDVAVCINAILSASLKKRAAFFHNLSACLKKGGHLILVVPSLESWLLTRILQNQWKIDNQLFKETLTGKEAMARYKNIQQGNAEIDNVPTKHYLKEELIHLLSNKGLAVQDCKKIEYNWKTEFSKPPRNLKEPGPWDWMIVAKKH
jgi:2-polyprenyl-3-methyl-5-hydroxy-6-metoxy-1,4-benzoquinol methylase